MWIRGGGTRKKWLQEALREYLTEKRKLIPISLTAETVPKIDGSSQANYL